MGFGVPILKHFRICYDFYIVRLYNICTLLTGIIYRSTVTLLFSFQVNIALLILELTTLAHPFNIWYQCRLHRNDGKCMPFQQKSIHIEPDDSKNQLTDCQQTGDENTFQE